jgi:hypothetical protein
VQLLYQLCLLRLLLLCRKPGLLLLSSLKSLLRLNRLLHLRRLLLAQLNLLPTHNISCPSCLRGMPLQQLFRLGHMPLRSHRHIVP